MIAVVAGTGNLPIYACKCLEKQKKDFFVLALFDDEREELDKIFPEKDKVIGMPLYNVGDILDALKKRGAKKVLFIGKIDKKLLLKKLKLSWTTIKMLYEIKDGMDSTILGKIGREIERNSMTLIRQDEILNGLFVPSGILCGDISNLDQENIDLGFNVAQKLCIADVGQTVVVKDKMILAVEAIEGTDECIKRAIKLADNSGGVTVCKTARKNQSGEFDLPTLGIATLESFEYGQVSVIAWKSDQTFIESKDKFIEMAKELDITLVSVA
jgi:UDP-2,3-diacylglucosamine hydrolase